VVSSVPRRRALPAGFFPQEPRCSGAFGHSNRRARPRCRISRRRSQHHYGCATGTTAYPPRPDCWNRTRSAVTRTVGAAHFDLKEKTRLAAWVATCHALRDAFDLPCLRGSSGRVGQGVPARSSSPPPLATVLRGATRRSQPSQFASSVFCTTLPPFCAGLRCFPGKLPTSSHEKCGIPVVSHCLITISLRICEIATPILVRQQLTAGKRGFASPFSTTPGAIFRA